MARFYVFDDQAAAQACVDAVDARARTIYAAQGYAVDGEGNIIGKRVSDGADAPNAARTETWDIPRCRLDGKWVVRHCETVPGAEFVINPGGNPEVTVAAFVAQDIAAGTPVEVEAESWWPEPQFSGTLSGTEAADAAALSGSTGSGVNLATTEGQDRAAATAATTITGTLSAAETQDTAALSSAGAASPLSTTERADDAQIAGATQSQGSLAAAERGDSASGVGGGRTGAALSGSDASDAVAAAGGSRTAGSLAGSEASDSAALTAAAGISAAGDLAGTEGRDTAAIRGEMFTKPNLILIAQRRGRAVLSGRRISPMVIKAHRADS